MLTLEEELMLGRQMREDENKDARETLVHANLRLVVTIASRYQNPEHGLLELIQDGNEGLLKAVKELGLKGFMKDFSDVSDLKEYVLEKKIPVIVDWFCCEDGHYSVVVDIDEKNIALADPQFVRVRKMDLDTFKRVWFDFPNDFLKSKDEIIIRRMIVIGK